MASYLAVSFGLVLPLWTRFENAPVLMFPILIVFGVLQTIQRCPRCGHRVMKNRGVNWLPRECPQCRLSTTAGWEATASG